VPDALRRIRALLGAVGEGAEMGRFLPAIPDSPERPLKLRAGVASTFVAGLELAREGVVRLDQAEPFGAIELRPAGIPEMREIARPAA
jgi:segregation and condensation protein A